MLSNLLRRPFAAAAASVRRTRGLEEFFEGGSLKKDEPLVVGREWKVSLRVLGITPFGGHFQSKRVTYERRGLDAPPLRRLQSKFTSVKSG